MVKKRKVLASQAKNMYSNESPTSRNDVSNKKAVTPITNKSKRPTVAPPDFIKKVNILKRMIMELKQILSSEEFKKLNVSEIRKHQT